MEREGEVIDLRFVYRIRERICIFKSEIDGKWFIDSRFYGLFHERESFRDAGRCRLRGHRDRISDLFDSGRLALATDDQYEIIGYELRHPVLRQ